MSGDRYETRVATPADAALAGAAFYAANGFVEVGRGETHLTTGRPIESAFMRKPLAPLGGRRIDDERQ